MPFHRARHSENCFSVPAQPAGQVKQMNFGACSIQTTRFSQRNQVRALSMAISLQFSKKAQRWHSLQTFGCRFVFSIRVNPQRSKKVC